MSPWYLKITSAVQAWSLGKHLIDVTLISEDNKCCPGLVTGETPADEATGAVLEAARAVEGMGGLRTKKLDGVGLRTKKLDGVGGPVDNRPSTI